MDVFIVFLNWHTYGEIWFANKLIKMKISSFSTNYYPNHTQSLTFWWKLLQANSNNYMKIQWARNNQETLWNVYIWRQNKYSTNRIWAYEGEKNKPVMVNSVYMYIYIHNYIILPPVLIYSVSSNCRHCLHFRDIIRSSIILNDKKRM